MGLGLLGLIHKVSEEIEFWFEHSFSRDFAIFFVLQLMFVVFYPSKIIARMEGNMFRGRTGTERGSRLTL